jgi:hypothetical protein
MALIDKTYFIGELYLPQMGQPDVVEVLNIFIDQREKQYFYDLLGYAFGKTAYDGINADPLEDKWDELLNGGEYYDRQNVLQYWPGIVTDDKVSPLANFIYYWYTREKASSTTGSGEQQDGVPAAKAVSPAPKQARAWNQMVDLHRKMVDFLRYKKDGDGNYVYPDFVYSRVSITKEFKNLTTKMNSMNL